MSVEFLGHEVEAVVFDVDGTLHDPRLLPIMWGGVRRQQAENLLHKKGVPDPLDEKDILNMVLLYVAESERRGSFHKGFIAMGGTDADFLQIVEDLDVRKFLSPDPILSTMLSRLHSSLQVGLLSGSPERSVNKTCTALLGSDWKNLFHNIHCLDTLEIIWHKPEPEAFKHLLFTLGVKPNRAIMVGDLTSADLEPGHSLGMFTVQVGLTDYREADLQIDKVTDLINHLKFI